MEDPQLLQFLNSWAHRLAGQAESFEVCAQLPLLGSDQEAWIWGRTHSAPRQTVKVCCLSVTTF